MGVLVALALIVAACGDDDEPTGDTTGDTSTGDTTADTSTGDTTGDTAGDDSADGGGDTTLDCSEAAPFDPSILHPEPAPARIDPYLVVIPEERADDFFERFVVTGELDAQRIVISDPGDGEVALATVLSDRYGLEGAFGNVNEVGSAANSRWEAVESRISTLHLPGGNAAEVLLAARQEEYPIEPVHMAFASSHFGAYPGVAPQICSRQGLPPASDAVSTGRRIGVVDTGFDSSSLAETEAVDADPSLQSPSDDCRVSHGEFIASVIRQIDPSAEIVGRRAFWYDPSNGWYCWVSNEYVIRAALLDLPVEDGLDAISLSFGSVPHIDPEENFDYSHLTFEETFGFVASLEEPPAVYAAAGNTLSTEPIYPAAFEPTDPAGVDPVIAVAATDHAGQWLRWNTEEVANVGYQPETTGVPPAWIDILAPGCEIVGLGAGVGEVVIWSGSSFATPIAAALGWPAGISNPILYDVLPTDSFVVGQTDPRQC